jgi:hypothetical protein
VAAAEDCTWTSTSAVSWITIASGGTGSGGGTVSLNIAENTGSTHRTGTISIAGKSYTITQSGACDYTTSPTAITVGGGATSANVWVTAGVGCAWTVQNPASWVTPSTTSGSGGGMVSLTIAANSSTSARTTTLTVGDTSVVITQAGATCNYMVSPVSLNVSSGTRAVTVTAPTGCAWTASATAPWITFPNGASGSGSASLSVLFEANSGGTTRFATIMIAGWRIFVTQSVTTPPEPPAGMRIVK